MRITRTKKKEICKEVSERAEILERGKYAKKRIEQDGNSPIACGKRKDLLRGILKRSRGERQEGGV